MFCRRPDDRYENDDQAGQTQVPDTQRQRMQTPRGSVTLWSAAGHKFEISR
jgi:hypothetical protein